MPIPEHEQNRAVWNEIVDVHYRHPDYRVKEFLQGATTLKSIELDELGDVNGKRLLHLFCQFGLDTFSWARRGALVTGVDISDRSIEHANELKQKTGLRAELVRSDVLELVGKIDRKFDIVFQSYGTHHWISDLHRWAQVVAHHLVPGGVFYMVDLHPIAIPWEEKDVSYFNVGPHRYAKDVDYCDKEYVIQGEKVEWQHTLGNIITAVINAGLTLEFLHEFDKCCYPRESGWVEKDGFYYPPGPLPRYPLMFSLRAHLGRPKPSALSQNE